METIYYSRGVFISIIFSSILLLFFAPLYTYAADVRTGEELSIAQSEVIDDNLYAAGGVVSISGRVEGDVVGAGGEITFDGTARNDVTLAGGNITIISPVNGDVRVAGGDVTVQGTVNGDLVAAGGQVKTTSRAAVARDALIFGGVVFLDGNVAGDTQIFGGEVFVNGSLIGDTRIRAEKITLGENASIVGDLVYSSQEDLTEEELARVQGEVTREDFFEGGTRDANGFFAGVFGFFFVMKLIALIVAGLLFVLLYKEFSQNYVNESREAFWKSLLIGFAVLILPPIAAVLLFISMIGGYVGAIILALWFLALIVAGVFGGIVFGALLQKYLLKQTDVHWTTVVLGTIILGIVNIAPVIGWLITCVFFLVSLGVFSTLLYRKTV